ELLFLKGGHGLFTYSFDLSHTSTLKTQSAEVEGQFTFTELPDPADPSGTILELTMGDHFSHSSDQSAQWLDGFPTKGAVECNYRNGALTCSSQCFVESDQGTNGSNKLIFY